MSDGNLIALVFLIIGVLMIIVGVIGVFREKRKLKTEEEHTNQSTPPPASQPKGSGSNNIMEKMQSDEELQRKIRSKDKDDG